MTTCLFRFGGEASHPQCRVLRHCFSFLFLKHCAARIGIYIADPCSEILSRLSKKRSKATLIKKCLEMGLIKYKNELRIKVQPKKRRRKDDDDDEENEEEQDDDNVPGKNL